MTEIRQPRAERQYFHQLGNLLRALPGADRLGHAGLQVIAEQNAVDFSSEACSAATCFITSGQ